MVMSKMGKESVDDCSMILGNTSMFACCSSEILVKMCKQMTKEQYLVGEILYRQNEKQGDMALISSGRVQRQRRINDQLHTLSSAVKGNLIGAHHVLRKDKSSATCKCLTDVTAYKLSADKYEELLACPEIAHEVVYSLNREIRRQANLLQAPLLSQHPKPTPYVAISIAAGVESFYRSALNASLNAKLTGQPATSLFPNMTVQVPSRVLYINGFKGIRHVLDQHIKSDDAGIWTRLGVAVGPGVIMTPISSVLEACNAGHMNPEGLSTRWIRGFVPRTFREVVFGVGLNQLSDYFEERVRFVDNLVLRNATASVVAGVIAGYCSHVPHNLSTMKLMTPHKTYPMLINDFIRRSESRVPTGLKPNARYAVAALSALFFPRGLGIRTTQIVGSFIILNGTINSLKDFNAKSFVPDRFQSIFSK